MRLRQQHLRKNTKRILLVLFLVLNALDVLHVRQNLAHHHGAPPSAPARPSQRIFIASIFWNNEAILRASWNAALLALVKHLGPENVFVSIHESGSWDGTKDALRELDEALGAVGAQRNISMSGRTHKDEIGGVAALGGGWVVTPEGKREVRRIPFLAGERNVGLEALVGGGRGFDRVVFLNDVVFEVEDVVRLLGTNGGEYAAACAMDFKHPPGFYDTFALRDSQGDESLMQTWPYFRSRESRSAMKAGRPVPVSSCWNGMVAMPAHPFTGPSPLRFRGIPDSLAAAHLEGSECCLIHADNPLSPHKGVFVNPQVRVGYTREAYDAVRVGERGLSSWRIFLRLWENRVRRWTTTTVFNERVVRKRVGAWEKGEEGRKEVGEFCLINEMQVLRGNGWAHV